MTMAFRIIAVCGAVAVSAFARPAASHSHSPDKTTWDSVYTAAQAAHGDSVYKASCMKCHGPALKGTETDGGPLVGKEFLDGWNGMTLDQLYNKIDRTMPSDNPKTLPAKDVADVMAFILSQNQFPAGASPLTENMDSLKSIKLTTSKP